MSRHHLRAGIVGSRRWQRLRRYILKRDKWRCRICGRPGRMEIDHLVPLEQGGDPWEPSNLAATCRTCHIRKTAAENTKAGPEVVAWRELVRAMVRQG